MPPKASATIGGAHGDQHVSVKPFAFVVREGSISGAARWLGVSQSAVSQHIAKLEAVMGAQVLIRGRDDVALTPVGQDLFSTG